MARSTFKVLFYLKRQSEKNGKAPVMGRITVNGTISQFSCKLNIRPSLWDAKANKAAGKSVEAQRINEKLEKIKALIIKQYDKVSAADNYVSAEKVKNAWQGFGSEYKKVLELYDEHLTRMKTRIGKDRAQATYDNWIFYRDCTADFMKVCKGLEDIPIRELEPGFIEEFVTYLKSDRGFSSGSIGALVIHLKWVTRTAHAKGWIGVDPFCSFHFNAQYKERRFLSEDELQVLMNAKLQNISQERIRDIFVFCCFTGLAYADVKHLTYDDLHTKVNGEVWIDKFRHKTNTPFAIRLLPVVVDLIEKYRGTTDGIHVFTVKGRINMNSSLKVIARQCGFNFTLSTHLGRHTFATTVTLSQGVPLETVSKMLGHKNITTTQIYAKITRDKIARDMDVLTEKIGDRFKLAQ